MESRAFCSTGSLSNNRNGGERISLFDSDSEIVVLNPRGDNMVKYPQWLVLDEAFSAEECEIIKEQAKKHATQIPAGTFGSHGEEFRKTNIRWLNDDDQFGWVHQRFREIAYEVNKFFQMKLTHLPAIQFTEYDGVGSHYDYHGDTNWNDQSDTHRKISICIQLSDPEDYEGGRFMFKLQEQPDEVQLKRQGAALTFISYHDHAVMPIESGQRYSLVGWFEGPRFS